MKTPTTYYGGKQQLRHVIVPIITAQPHHLYAEPFAGGAAIYFALPKADVEVLNDINGFVSNFYRVCQTDFERLQTAIRGTLHSRESHIKAKVVYDHPDMFSPLRKAWAFWVLCNQGFSGSISNSWGYGVAQNKSELRLKNKRAAFTEEICKRLELTQIECTDALHILETRDRETSFFYCDPPYFNADMAHYAGYTKQDFINLLDTLAGIKGKFLLSSYPSDVLSEYVAKHGWTQREIDMRVSVSNKGKRKIESLVANFPFELPKKG